MVNPHLRNLDYVISLAQIEANNMKQDQAIYKTKDAQRYEIYQFIETRNFGGTAVAIVRYTGGTSNTDILQDNGIGESATISEEPKPSKGKRSWKAK
jgi:hypothetical protein